MYDKEMVKFDGVFKKFCRSLRRSLWYGVQDLTSEIFPRQGLRNLRQDEFWAVDDISFSVNTGDVFGIIGPNGAGKTTLLRMLNGLIKPDRGEISIRGRVGALIALGAGFNPILTGRENVYINAAVLGISKREVDLILEDIIEFADLGEFINTPVQNYSSGMRVRLGFSVAAHLKPDVFLIDEVLSVGDYSFREKSIARMTRICNSGAAVIFVSHNLSSILTICHRVLWLERGKIQMLGQAEEVVKAYLESQEKNANRLAMREVELSRKNEEAFYEQMRISRIELMNRDGEVTTDFIQGEDLRVRIHYETSRPIPDPHFIIQVGTQKEILIVADMLIDDISPGVVEGSGTIECLFPSIPLLSNRYIINVFVMGKSPTIKIVFPPKQIFFTVKSINQEISIMSYLRNSGVISVPTEWRW